MTDELKQKIITLRRRGVGYLKISKELDLSVNTVKSFCRRCPEAKEPEKQDPANENIKYCKNCGAEVRQNPGRKEKLFCSDRCRSKWWNAHLNLVNKKAIYNFTCPTCNKPFTAYGNANRKYCSHKCYLADRFGGDFID